MQSYLDELFTCCGQILTAEWWQGEQPPATNVFGLLAYAIRPAEGRSAESGCSRVVTELETLTANR